MGKERKVKKFKEAKEFKELWLDKNKEIERKKARKFTILQKTSCV